ncbi:MAG: MATE family efflux transporter [Firmicutes bacterium]|nr:MATE family efflux transporter [Bacillota bacterium]
MKKLSDKKILTKGDVKTVLIKLTIPMIFGIFSMVIYNLADTYFVGQLGKNQLAALSYTFPVILIISSLAQGIGMGTSSVLSRAIGGGDDRLVKRLATDSLFLGLIIVILCVTIGELTIEPIFSLLGAKENTLPYIKEYMRVWYLGMIFVVIPMVGNNIIRATGDSKTPGMVMVIGALINISLDPLFIFGLGPFPKLGITGAALATLIGRMVTFTVALYILIHREKLILFKKPILKETLNSWKQILFVGLPNAGTKMIIPLGVGIITGIISPFGTASVAAYGVASKIEFFAIATINALSSVIAPFMGQNWGAKLPKRVREGFKQGEIFSIINGIIISILLIIFSKPIAKAFNDDPLVIKNITLYIKIVPFTYTLQGIYLITTASLNALNKPIHASSLSILEMFIFCIPLAFILSKSFGLIGVFTSISIAYILTGLISHLAFKKILNKKIKAFKLTT